MSRTDKDLPYWYAEHYEPIHRCGEFGLTSYSKYFNKPCDLPPLTYKELRKGGYWGNRRTHTCFWDPVPSEFKGRWYDKNPSWWTRDVWTKPTRQMVRDRSTKALQDYNANGDTDVDIPNFRRKHEGGWYW